jgi:hypothetical protein
MGVVKMNANLQQAAKTRGAEVVKLRETDGWRRGKPMEDPEKQKRWGFITAKPSEYLVHVRRGRVLLKSSGQGATCFKWPNDAVAIVPTSIQQLVFSADQVTAEKVGVEVVGLAVYRIADPLLAYRVLNFSYPERAQEKLEETLTSMFIGATRRLVANLSVEDCLQKRKSALAEELLREVAPVVGGTGRPDDATEQGWGIVLDTIEIQEVRVLSDKVFASMQAPYRTALEQKTSEAKIKSDAAVREQREEANLRALELTRKQKDAELSARRAIEERTMETEAALRAQKASFDAREAEERTEVAIRKRELVAKEIEAELASFESDRVAREKRAELARAEALLELELRRSRAEVLLAEGRVDAEVALAMAEAEARRAEAVARVEIAKNMPALAAAIGSRIGEVKIAQYGGSENPFAALLGGLTAILDMARAKE